MNSQNLIKEVNNLNKTVLSAQRKLEHLKSETSQLQTKRDNVQSEIEEKTSKLLIAQKKELDFLVGEYKIVIANKVSEVKTLDSEIVEKETKIESLQNEINTAKYDLDKIFVDIDESKQSLLEVEKQKTSVLESIQPLKNKLDQINRDIETSSNTLTDIKVEIEQEESTLSQLKYDIKNLNLQYESDKNEKENIISDLNAKLLNITQSIEEKTQEFDKQRTDLAQWQSMLEQRDKNLRLRELKVEEGENKIVQNHNLLNL